MTAGSAVEPLLLDEMFSPRLGEALRDEGIDALAVAGHPVLAAESDLHVATWAAREGRRVLTENVRDFVPLLSVVEMPLQLLLTSSRRYPRSRQNPAPLLRAVRQWVFADAQRSSLEWLP